MPDPTELPYNLYERPSFMYGMHEWGADPSLAVPDPMATFGRDEADMMTIVNAMLGPGGYMKYVKALQAQREKDAEEKKKKARAGSPAAPPSSPPLPTPGSDIGAGIDRINKAGETLEEKKKKLGI